VRGNKPFLPNRAASFQRCLSHSCAHLAVFVASKNELRIIIAALRHCRQERGVHFIGTVGLGLSSSSTYCQTYCQRDTQARRNDCMRTRNSINRYTSSDMAKPHSGAGYSVSAAHALGRLERTDIFLSVFLSLDPCVQLR
jgi:hypothetical protein